jgi:hypothetical protein
MHFTDIQYLKVIITKLLDMHDLKLNFDKFHLITKKYLSDVLNDQGNVQSYRNRPKMSDCGIIALSVCQEALGLDSELWFHTKIKSDYSKHFPHLPHITRYNCRRKRLAPWIQKLNEAMAREMNEGEDYFMVDSMPIPICKNAREKRLKVAVKYLKRLQIRVFQQ